MTRKARFLLVSASIIAVTLNIPPAALAGSGASTTAAESSRLNTIKIKQQSAAIAKFIQVFTSGVSAYVYENVRNVPWNQYESTAPVAYQPIDFYAGGNSSLCNFQTGSGTPVPGVPSLVNLTSPSNVPASNWNPPQSYLPASWTPPLGGTFCATVWLNHPSAKMYTTITYFTPASTAKSTDVGVTDTTIRGLALDVSRSISKMGVSGIQPFWTSGANGSGQMETPDGQPLN